MKNYSPVRQLKSVLDTCIYNAFKDTWEYIKKETLLEIGGGRQNIETQPFSYESFKLNTSNQNFEVSSSPLFESAKQLFEKMYANDKTTVKNVKLQYDNEVNNIDFNSSMFDTSTISEKISYIDAIKLAHQLYVSSPELIYGMLLHDGNKFINPLHPIITHSFSKHYKENIKNIIADASKEKYSIIIYTYKNGYKSGEILNDDFLYDDMHEELFANHIYSILALLEQKNEIYEKKISYVDTSNKNTMFDRYGHFEYTSKCNESSLFNVSLQPVQLVNDGIATPYYGIVAEQNRNGDVYGYQLAPMLSCNLGRVYLQNRQDSIKTSATSVCTGNFPKTSLAGKLSLNHAYLGSAYFKQIMARSAINFAQVSLKISISMYAELLELQPINMNFKKQKRILKSFASYKANNKDATLQDYLEYAKAYK